MPEKSSLRIIAYKLGHVNDVIGLLNDLNNAYNSMYAFFFLVDSLQHEHNKRAAEIDRRFNRLSKYFKGIAFDRLIDPYWEDDIAYASRRNLHSLLELQTRINFENIVPISERLYLSKVNIQSKGFWEIIGVSDVIKEIRECLKYRDEKRKDKNYRNRQQEQLGELEISEKQNSIIAQKIAILKNLGYSELEIRQLVSTMISSPMSQLDKRQDNGQIDGPDESS